MKKLFVTAAFLAAISSFEVCFAQAETEMEYQKKADYSYNFIKFVDWPAVAFDGNQITVGIIGKGPPPCSFDTLKGRKAKNKVVSVRQFPSFEKFLKSGKAGEKAINEQMESIKKCHLLFICSSESNYVKDILSRLRYTNILTVSETENFLQEGGIINFIVEDKKVRFEINLDASNEANLKISSRLLQIARKVIKTGG